MNEQQRKEFEATLWFGESKARRPSGSYLNDSTEQKWQTFVKAQAPLIAENERLMKRIAELEKLYEANLQSAGMLVARLEHHRDNSSHFVMVDDVFQLMHDCDYLASRPDPFEPAAQAVTEAKAACLKEWEDVNDPPCHPSDENWSPCATCLQSASGMTVEYKIANNIWDHVDDALRVIELARAGQWSWMANGRCKYIELRIDMRNGGCLIRNRDGERIDPEDFEKQLGRHFHGDGWPSNSAAQAVTDEPDDAQPCRDCADLSVNGVCPNSGKLCAPIDSAKAAKE